MSVIKILLHLLWNAKGSREDNNEFDIANISQLLMKTSVCKYSTIRISFCIHHFTYSFVD